MKLPVMLALVSLLLLAGCGGGGEKTKTVTVEESATAAAESATPGEAAASATPAPDEKAIASRNGTIDHAKVQLDVVQFKRSADTVALTIRLTLPGADEDDGNAQVADTFDNGQFEKVDGGDTIAGGNTMDGITLVDTKNQKRHLVGRDETGQCVCDIDLGSKFVDPAAPLLLSATYGAPPPDVESLSIVIPGFGTLADVPLV